MKKISILSFLMPTLVFAYPIYDEDAPLQNSPDESMAKQEDHAPSVAKSHDKRLDNPAIDVSLVDLEKKRSILTRRHSTQRASSKFRHRQNPNRPRVTHRDAKKQPEQQLPQIEADAEEPELSIYSQKEGREVSEIPDDEEVNPADAPSKKNH